MDHHDLAGAGRGEPPRTLRRGRRRQAFARPALTPAPEKQGSAYPPHSGFKSKSQGAHTGPFPSAVWLHGSQPHELVHP